MTLDYELFNGKESGSVNNSLITPMQELLKVLDKYNFKATVFVDTVYLNRLNEMRKVHSELNQDWKLIVSQLKNLHEKGHELQLHLHPNWLHATYENGSWNSVLTDYKLSDMSEEEVDGMFRDGIKILNLITNSCEVIAFRAGAYCIQTYSNMQNMFEKYGIKIDSSVYRNHKSITERLEYYDFIHVPKEYVYRFQSNVCIKEELGSYIEVSIPSFWISKIKIVRSKLDQRKSEFSSKCWGDGKGSIGTLDGKLVRLKKSLLAHTKPSRIVASIDGSNSYYLNYIFKKEKRKAKDYMLIMGHPKSFSPYSLMHLDKFLNQLSKNDKNITISFFA